MKRFCLILLLVVAVVGGWHVFEWGWDQRLFRDTDESMKVVNIGAKDAQRLLRERDDVQVVDVRPAKNYRSAHVPGAVNVTYAGGELDSAAAETLDRSRPLFVYCDGGFRSRLSLKAFREAGFEEIFHLHRGLLSWRFRGGECESGEGE